MTKSKCPVCKQSVKTTPEKRFVRHLGLKTEKGYCKASFQNVGRYKGKRK